MRGGLAQAEEGAAAGWGRVVGLGGLDGFELGCGRLGLGWRWCLCVGFGCEGFGRKGFVWSGFGLNRLGLSGVEVDGIQLEDVGAEGFRLA